MSTPLMAILCAGSAVQSGTIVLWDDGATLLWDDGYTMTWA